MFADRADAGKRLAERLLLYRGTDTVVLGLPRGGVAVGFEIARALSLPLDIVVVRKIGHPSSPEFAIGAVAGDGTAIYSVAAESVNPEWLRHKTTEEREEALRRVNMYRRETSTEDSLAGKTAIITDDGIATNLTMRLAVRTVKNRKPEKIVVAVPVAPQEALRGLAHEGVDDVIMLESPERFLGAVGSHYLHFPEVDDAEVVRLLAQAAEHERRYEEKG